jgi:hypothetical protein
MRLTDRSMLRIADDLRATDRAHATERSRIWVKEHAPKSTAPVERVHASGGLMARIRRMTTSGGHA